MIGTAEGPYRYVRVFVKDDGLHVEYHVECLHIPGREFVEDESVGSWEDDDIRDFVASLLGIITGKGEIEVVFD